MPKNRYRAAGLFVLILVLFGGVGCHARRQARAADRNVSTGTWTYKIDDKIKTITLTGSPYQRGYTHGKALKPQIHKVVELWKRNIRSNFSMDADRFVSQFMKSTDFLPAIRQWTPELLDEVKGISDGAEIDFNTIFLYQTVDEVWLNGHDVVNPNEQTNSNEAQEHCSAVGIQKHGSSPAVARQTMDIEPFYQGYQTVLHIKYDTSDLEALVLTAAGMIGLTGMNSHAIGVNANTLAQLERAPRGVPANFIVRKLLSQETKTAAVALLHQIPHASGQNYMISDPGGISDFECSAKRVLEYTDPKTPLAIFHTNHPLLSNEEHPRNPGSVFDSWSTQRFVKVAKSIYGKDPATLNKTTLDAIFSRYPVCNRGTFGRMVMTLSARPELEIKAGCPR